MIIVYLVYAFAVVYFFLKAVSTSGAVSFGYWCALIAAVLIGAGAFLAFQPS